MTITAIPDVEPRAAVRALTAGDVPRLAAVLAQAFYDDPVFAWFVRTPHHRMATIERFFRRIAIEGMTLRHGASLTTAHVDGGALWMPPGTAHAGAGQQLRLAPRMVRTFGRELGRAVKGMAALDAAHPHEDHWYLPFLGVSPVWQGQGLGGALLRPALARCDADGLPAYLEATSPRNRRLYERHGFATREVLHLPDDGPPLWLMWREPRAD